MNPNTCLSFRISDDDLLLNTSLHCICICYVIYLHFNVAIDAYVIWVWIDVNINSSREIRYGKYKSTYGQKWEEEAVDGSSAPRSWKQIAGYSLYIE